LAKRSPSPLFAKAETAAKLFELETKEFLGLVELGVLPPAQRLGKYERWHMPTLEDIACGNAAKPERSRFEV